MRDDAGDVLKVEDRGRVRILTLNRPDKLNAEGARLRAPFVSLGVAAEAGSTFLLPATIGSQATAKLLYSSEWLDATRTSPASRGAEQVT